MSSSLIPIHSISILLIILYIVTTAQAKTIQDCCCDTETVSANNQEFLNEILTVIRQRTFFRIFKVDIYKSCKLWPDNTLCFQATCSIRECCEEDVPQKWRDMDEYNQPIDLFVSESFNHWNNVDEDQWVSYSGNQEQMIYVDLEWNPDGYTGYKGDEASKIWKAIYDAKNLLYINIDKSHYDKYKTEDRVLFRLISGYHTLTTCMVFANWPLEHNPQQYGPNIQLYEAVLHGHNDWIENLYFDFVFLLRAINKASDMLSKYDYHTGNPSDDAMTMGLINYLLQTKFIKTQCNHLNGFDESQLFQGEQFEIMNNFRNVFRNISDIIDCVGCEKCKLHAKLELLGLGTALKILFTKDILSIDMFERNEILALIVTLGKYSDAIQFIEEMEQQIELNKLKTNIHGYVDINNELLPKNIDNLDVLISKTFKRLFENNSFDSCKQWKLFCNDRQRIMDEQQQIANNICHIYREFCGN